MVRIREVDGTGPQELASLLGPSGFLTILRIMCTAYTDMAPSSVSDDMSEIEITGEIVIHIEQRCREDGLMSLYVSTEHVDKTLYSGRGKPPTVDIVFRALWDRKRYVAFECKIVCEGDRASYRRYIVHGLNRYIAGKYSSCSAVGGMVGYVRAGTAARVTAEIHDKVAGLPSTTRTNPGFCVGDFTNCFESNHERTRLAPIRIAHLFFEFPYSSRSAE